MRVTVAPTLCYRCGDDFDEGCDPRDELAELDASLEHLKLKRYDLKRKINRFHSPIIRQLPPDVTSTIFEFCLPEITDHSLSPYAKRNPLNNHSIPLFLGAICSYWRDIAWSTPSLWSSLVFRDTGEFDSRIVTSLVQEWLARSGGLPLSIRISATFCNRAVLALVDIIKQYSTRWSDLVLDIPGRCHEGFHATENHAPILKSIRFHYTSTAITRKVNFNLTCPRLEKATLSYFPVKNNIPWDNLSHLTLYSMSIIDSFLILRKTPRLVFCEVSGCCRHTPDEQPLRTPVLTSLRSLHLLMDSSAAEYFLNNLIASQLEEFCFPGYNIPRIEVITSFLRRSACSLRSFSMIFNTSPSNFEGFIDLFQSMPSLTTLSITTFKLEMCRPPNILQLVTKVLSSQSTSLQQGFLPNLKILEIIGELYLRPGNYDDLCSLPPAHNAVHGPFHLLNLDLYRKTRIPQNMIPYISRLAERGVKVNVLSYSKDILQSSIDYYRCRKDSLSRDWSDNFDSSLFS